MTPLLLAASGAVVVGGVLCVTARDVRLIVSGLVLALIAGPLLVDPLPTAGPMAAGLVAALLAGDLAWLALRDRPAAATGARPGARIGWVPEMLLAVTAFVVGLSLGHDPGAPFSGLGAGDLARGAALALLVLALPQVLVGASSGRIGAGVLLLVAAALLGRGALGGSPSPLESLVAALLEVAAAGSVAVVLGLAPGHRPEGHRIAPPAVDPPSRPNAGVAPAPFTRDRRSARDTRPSAGSDRAPDPLPDRTSYRRAGRAADPLAERSAGRKPNRAAER
ncbi:MAG TPA: hypothetical protein VNF73_06045 [Candidatus Saccharimonadales bacterium]|nr:hypothetical protein [Candidatus Saccharimonadales bacterium]